MTGRGGWAERRELVGGRVWWGEGDMCLAGGFGILYFAYL